MSKKVAVIGSGPSSVIVATTLSQKGIEVKIFEKEEKLGGLLRYGIPDFRLDRNDLDKSLETRLKNIEYQTSCELGKDIHLSDLRNEYDAIYLGIGANEGIINLSGNNVLSANKLLLEYNRNKDVEYYTNMFKDKIVYVNGGGNVAMDVSRTIARLGGKVEIIYRRSLQEMPAKPEEIKDAEADGVKINFLTNILEVNDGKIKTIKTQLVKKENEDRLSPVNVEGTEEELDYDYLILAIGAKTNKELLINEGLELNEKGFVKVNEKCQTNFENVFAGGDILGEKATIQYATMSGIKAANSMINFLGA
jgi:NADPH-dependent glutamate synthase beta subunit-like oxidoreductase